DGLFRTGKNIRHLRHEVHSAKNQKISISLRGEIGEFEGISGQISMLVNVCTLVMMCQYDGMLSQFSFGSDDALRTHFVLQQFVVFKINSVCLHNNNLMNSASFTVKYDHNLY